MLVTPLRDSYMQLKYHCNYLCGTFGMFGTLVPMFCKYWHDHGTCYVWTFHVLTPKLPNDQNVITHFSNNLLTPPCQTLFHYFSFLIQWLSLKQTTHRRSFFQLSMWPKCLTKNLPWDISMLCITLCLKEITINIVSYPPTTTPHCPLSYVTQNSNKSKHPTN